MEPFSPHLPRTVFLLLSLSVHPLPSHLRTLPKVLFIIIIQTQNSPWSQKSIECPWFCVWAGRCSGDVDLELGQRSSLCSLIQIHRKVHFSSEHLRDLSNYSVVKFISTCYHDLRGRNLWVCKDEVNEGSFLGAETMPTSTGDKEMSLLLCVS